MRAMRLPRFTDASLYWICIVVLVAALVDLTWLHRVEPVDLMLGDELMRLRAPSIKADPDIVIIDIDDRALAEMTEGVDDKDTGQRFSGVGRFPWPRAVYGELIAELEAQGAKAIVLDVELYEPDSQNKTSDDVLNEVVAGTTNTFFPIQTLETVKRGEGVRIAEHAKQLALRSTGTASVDATIPMELPFVLDPASGAWARTGLINFYNDLDGVGRRYWIDHEIDGYVLPSLPARVARALGWPVPAAETLGLAWPASDKPHRTVTFSDIYFDLQRSKRKRPPDEFKNKIVIIGSTASYLRDFRTTPISSKHPGVEILATAIDNLKQGRQIVSAPNEVRYVIVLLLFASLLFALQRRANLITIVIVLGVGSALIVGGAYAALAAGGILVPVATPLVFAWLFYLLAALRAYLKEQRAKEQRETVLSRFLDGRLVKQLVAEGVKLEDFKSETRTITVLFSGIRGFTSLSETRPAEEIVALLNRYLSLQAETVFRHGGTLDKFIGDAIMAFWNAPTDDSGHAEHAVSCALDMVQTLERFNADLQSGGMAPLDIGVGVHTGPAVVGFVGSQRKLEYTAIGDTVNLASRIEGETKGRTRVLVTASTREAVGASFRFTDWGALAVKGRVAQVNVYAPELLA